MNINGSTEIVGIFGYPVDHTLSPHIQNAAFAALNLNCIYIPCKVAPRALPAAVNAIRALGLKGANVTVPHKEKVLSLLDRIDPLARRIGSVNTIVNNAGVLTGFNTDAAGFMLDLKAQGGDPRHMRTLLIGAGGAARAVAFALAREHVKSLSIVSRTARRAQLLADAVPHARCIRREAIAQTLDRIDLVINTSPLGMHPNDPSPVPGALLRKDMFVYDIVYNRPTRLLKDAAKAGAAAAGGTGMLLRQGMLAFELWTGRKAPAGVMKKALETAVVNENHTQSRR